MTREVFYFFFKNQKGLFSFLTDFDSDLKSYLKFDFCDLDIKTLVLSIDLDLDLKAEVNNNNITVILCVCAEMGFLTARPTITLSLGSGVRAAADTSVAEFWR